MNFNTSETLPTAVPGGAPRVRRWGTLLAAAIAAAPTVALAQAIDYGALENLFGEPVTMTVTGSPKRVSDAPVSMEIVTAADIRKIGARDLVGVLRHVAGVDYMRTSNDHAEVSVRGYNEAFSSRLLVLVNGRQVYADYYGFTPWSAVPVEVAAIRQIEIVRGPNSALYGFNAVGGVINIVTYDPLLEDLDTATATVGTQSLSEGSAVSTFRTGEKTALRLMLGRRSDEDFSTPQKPFDVGTRPGNERTSVSLEGAIAVNDNVRVDLEVTGADSKHTELSPVLATSFARYDTNSLKGAVTAETSIGLLEAVLYRNTIDAVVDAAAGQPIPRLRFDSDVDVAQIQDVFKIGTRNTLRLSGEYRTSTMATTPIAGGEVSYDIFAAAVMWEWQIDPSLTMTTALRRDRLSLGRTGFLPPGVAATNELWDRTIEEPSFNTGFIWHATDRDTYRFAVARGTQLPNLSDLGGYLDFIPFVGYVGGYPFLEPTVVRNIEAGWVRRLEGLDAYLDVAVFHGRTSNIESLLGGGRPDLGLLGVPANLGSSNSVGVTASLDGAFGDGWRWSASYTAQRIRDSLAPDALVRGITSFEDTTPRHVVKGRLGWSGGPWEVDGFVHYQSRSSGVVITDPFTLTGMLEPVPSFVAFDARVGFALNDRMTVAVSGQNLTHDAQRQAAAPDVERRLLGGVTFRF